MADALEIPLGTWLNYESGIAVPAEIVLQLQVLTSVSARWLLTGEGEKYDRRRPKLRVLGCDGFEPAQARREDAVSVAL